MIQLKKWAENLNIHFPKEDIKMANRYMQRGLVSQIIRDTQIETAIRYHFMCVRILLFKRQVITNIIGDVEKREHLCTIGGNINCCSHYGKQYGNSSKN